MSTNRFARVPYLFVGAYLAYALFVFFAKRWNPWLLVHIYVGTWPVSMIFVSWIENSARRLSEDSGVMWGAYFVVGALWYYLVGQVARLALSIIFSEKRESKV